MKVNDTPHSIHERIIKTEPGRQGYVALVERVKGVKRKTMAERLQAGESLLLTMSSKGASILTWSNGRPAGRVSFNALLRRGKVVSADGLPGLLPIEGRAMGQTYRWNPDAE